MCDTGSHHKLGDEDRGKKKKRRGRDIDAMADIVEVFKGRCTK
jgi:hypothetical protein